MNRLFKLPKLYAGLKQATVAPVRRMANTKIGYWSLFSHKIPTTMPGLHPNTWSSAAKISL